MKILVTDKIAEGGLELLRAEGWEVCEIGPKDLDAIKQALPEANAWLLRSGTKVTAELLACGPKLKAVGRAGVGIDNIDLEAATRRGVLVMNTPGGNAVSVAEHALGLILALARKIPGAAASMHEGKWEKKKFGGTELRGKTLGIVGLGRIGQEVARRAQAFEMTVAAHDPFVAQQLARDIDVELLELDELLGRADYLTLHVALTPQTDKLLNKDRLAKLKPGARILNTARGELVEEDALLEALESGQVAGAALDVFATEPPFESPLLQHPNVIATPHIGGSSAEAQEEVGIKIAEQVRDYLKAGVVRNAVNLPGVSAEEYRRLHPYLELAERLGAFAAQVAGPASRVHLTYAGEVGELNTALLRNAALKGVLKQVLDEPANLINAATLAAERGLRIEEARIRHSAGFPNTLGVTLAEEETQFAVEGAVVHGQALRLLNIDGIDIEAPLEGNLIFTRNRDVPGVIGHIGTLLGARNVNIATFALGRRDNSGARSGSMGNTGPGGGAEALAIIRVDVAPPEAVIEALRGIPAVTFARVVVL